MLQKGVVTVWIPCTLNGEIFRVVTEQVTTRTIRAGTSQQALFDTLPKTFN